MAEIVGELHFRKITQRKLAKQMGVSEVYLSRVLNGQEKPAANFEQRMRDALEQITKEGA